MASIRRAGRIRPPGWLKKYRLELGVALLGLLVINVVSIIFRESQTVDRPGAGQLGDFVGGYIGTIFSLISVVLVVATLRGQQTSTAHDNCENRYFELLKFHRDNVAELQLAGATGRHVFALLIRELREIIPLVRAVADEQQYRLEQLDRLRVSFFVLMFGTGANQSRVLKSSLAGFDAAFVDALEHRLNCDDLKRSVRDARGFPHLPFEGHQSRLGHYYRHLYQTVTYVDDHAGEPEKYGYVKTIRAQLTTHEQALLLVNSLTPIGRNWWSKGFITRYRLVQNLPRNYFDPEQEIDVATLFPAGYFEWEERLADEIGRLA